MAATKGKLNVSQIEEIISSYSVRAIEDIGNRYMGFDDDFMNDLQRKYGIDIKNISRDIIRFWANKNDGEDPKRGKCELNL